MNEVVLAVDCGTQSLRTLLFDMEGRLLAGEKIEYEPYFSTEPGWAEQDADVYWQSLCKGCLALKERHADLFGRICGIGLAAQRNTMIGCSRQGEPLRPAITWLDQRKAAPVFRPGRILRAAARSVGALDVVMRARADGKCNWIMQNEPDIWRKTAKYLQVSGFLNYRLTGAFKDSAASQIGHVPFHYKKRKWAGRYHVSSFLFPVGREKLPRVVEPGEAIGSITAEAARQTGLTEGIPVIACGSDKGCETVGMGVCGPETASLSFGTTATVQTTSSTYFEPLRFMPAYPSPVPGRYNPEVEIFRGYWMITWYKNEFAHPETVQAGKDGLAPEVLMDRLLEETAPGAMGLVLQPFWSPGLAEPDAKGAIIGFGDVHTRAHVYRAVIEGLAFALLEGLERIESKSGRRVTQLAVSGGASRSDHICRISADVFNRPLVRGDTGETSGLGAAIVTAAGLGYYPDVHKAVEKMVRYEKRFLPDSAAADLYDRLYRKVYRKMYDALKPLYKQIREITGYPADRPDIKTEE